MSEAPHKRWDARIAARLVAPLRDTAITPNHLTTVRLLIGLLGCAAIAHGGYAWSNTGAVLFALSCLLDHTDGELARLTGKTSRFGHYYDLGSDALITVLVFVSMGIGLGAPEALWPVVCGVLAGVAICAIFWMRHVIEQRLGKEGLRQPHLGAFEAEDVLYLLPLVTLADLTREFLLLAAIGAPLFCLWVAREYLRLVRSGQS
jgi:phosphatidylglycerophosphate synthase